MSEKSRNPFGTAFVVVAAVLASPLVAGALQTPTAAGASTRPSAPATPAPAGAVTLISGDRVVLDGKGFSVQPGAGRSRIRFLSQTIKNHRYVIPSDALALVNSGRVDKRLFDVTALAPLGASVPLLVSYPRNALAKTRVALAAGGAQVTRDLSAVDLLAVRADLGGRRSLWSSITAGAPSAQALSPGFERIWLDGKRRVSSDNVDQIGAPAAWKAGYDGTGVKVAILDTGVDQTHPDLVGQIAGTANFTTMPDVDDVVGHGTHVASIIAGTGVASSGRYRGVAPGAKLLIGKVCESESCDDSAILAGMVWAAPLAPVVNMSLGSDDTPEIDPLEQAVNDLSAQYNTLFVVAAGNDGAVGSVGSPSTAAAALSVGAVDGKDRLADFSSRGPAAGDNALKPDITAPGVAIVAAKAAHGVIGDPAPVAGYTVLSGTSMATPHVAAAAAILTQEHPSWSSALRKSTLMGAAKPADATNVFDQGAGRVDVAREIGQTVAADPPSLGFGLQQWPHGDDKPVARTVTYTNAGTGPVELSLAGPGGAFTVADTRLTVPAGGTASTTVTADTSRPALKDGRLGGYLTATAAGGVRVETPLGVVREVESYDVTITHTNRDGTPSINHLTDLYDLDANNVINVFQAQGTQTVRVAKGRYGVLSWINDDKTQITSMLTQSELDVDHRLTLNLDARTAKPVKVTAPKAGAGIVLAALNAEWNRPQSVYSSNLIGLDLSTLYCGALGGSKSFFLASFNVAYAAPGPQKNFRNSPYTIDLAYFKAGKFFDGLIKAPELTDLAAIRADYAAEAPGMESPPTEGSKSNVAEYGSGSGSWSVPTSFDLPFHRTEYVNTDVQWSGTFAQQLPATSDGSAQAVSSASSARQPYQAGHAYAQSWNRAVFGPQLSSPPAAAAWASRQGDQLIAYVPMFGDGSGHVGDSLTATQKVTLYRGKTKIGEGNQFTLKPGTASYRLEATSTRGAPHTLSTMVDGVWTFTSGHVGGTADQRLPLSSVRFDPKLNNRNSAPAGHTFVIPVIVERQPGSTAGKVRSLTVEVSYNDGKTWQKAKVSAYGDSRTATVTHPRGAGFVSLRATSTDTKGNSLRETIIRAYAIG